MAIAHRFRSEIADARLDVHAAVRLDDDEAAVPGRPGDDRARRHAVAANFRPLTLAALRLALVPPEYLRAAIERLLHERARRIRALTARVRRTEFGFSFGRVDPMDGHLIDTELARRLGENRFDQHDALHATRLTLRTPRRRVREHRHAAPLHGLRLTQERHHAAGHARIADRLVRTGFVDDEHVERRDAAVSGESDFQPAVHPRTRAADVVPGLALDGHHPRRIQSLRPQRRDDCGDRTGRFTAETAPGVLADDHDVFLIEMQPP